MGRRERSRTRSRPTPSSGSRRQLAVIAVSIAIIGTVAFQFGAFSSVEGVRGVEGGVASEQSALVGTETAAQVTVPDNQNPTHSGGIVFTHRSALRSYSASTGVTEWRPQSVDVIGPQIVDFDGDGQYDLPYLVNKNSIRLIDRSDRRPRKINIPRNKADTQKSGLAVGSWNGYDQAIFYVGQGHSTIYRVSPSSSPETVATPDNGANMVLGPGDIDGDGSAELVFVDGSQTVRYIEPSGTVKSTGVGAGSSSNIGAGRPADFDRGGTATVPIVDGSNKIKLVDSSGVTAQLLTGSEQAAKSRLGVSDVDTDGALEITYIQNANAIAGLNYIDDVGGSNSIQTHYTEEGRQVTADKRRGVAGGQIPRETGDDGAGEDGSNSDDTDGDNRDERQRLVTITNQLGSDARITVTLQDQADGELVVETDSGSSVEFYLSNTAQREVDIRPANGGGETIEFRVTAKSTTGDSQVTYYRTVEKGSED